MLKIFQKDLTKLADEDLVQYYKNKGDQSALGVLYDRYIELVFGVCLRYFKDSGAAEDAVMNIYEELVEKVKKYDIQNFRPWLQVLTRNHCLMQLRKKKIIVEFDPAYMQSDQLEHPTYGENIENKEEKALASCIEQLAQEQKKCIQYFYYKDKSYKEIADLFDLPLGKVRSFIQNGRRNLRNCLEKQKITR